LQKRIDRQRESRVKKYRKYHRDLLQPSSKPGGSVRVVPHQEHLVHLNAQPLQKQDRLGHPQQRHHLGYPQQRQHPLR
jgi:hypothetical protein